MTNAQQQRQQHQSSQNDDDSLWNDILAYHYDDGEDGDKDHHDGVSKNHSNQKKKTPTKGRDRDHMDVPFSPKDILNEIYWYIVDDSDDVTSSNELCISHVVNALHYEGIWFWRDLRFEESHKVAYQLAGLVHPKQQQTDSIDSKTTANNNNKMTHEDIALINQISLTERHFFEFVRPCAHLFLKAFVEEFVIPDWTTFVTDMTYHFHKVSSNEDGLNAQYIPILKEADPNKWAVSFCSTDGQRFSIGDYTETFSLQSVSKPITASLCLSTDGMEYVEEWVGCEPSGRPFNSQDLMPQTNIPYNASMNSGAIMSAGIYASQFPEEDWFQVVDRIRDTWYHICGDDMEVGFSKETFDSEKETAYNNFAIAYNLKGRRGLPRDVDLHKMLDVYLGCCSLEMCVEALAVAAATLANGGICPITSKEVFPAHVVRYVLSETMTCGMYDQSGHFAVNVGVPSKSGVSGVLMVIVPNVFGYATFSPRLNSNGNSVRGIEFSKRLVKSYRVHLFEPLRADNTGAKVDPRTNGRKSNQTLVGKMSWALHVGDVWATRLRDIHLFAMVQASIASREGLTQQSRQLIYNHYQMTYQQPLSDTLMKEVVDAVLQSSSSSSSSSSPHIPSSSDNAACASGTVTCHTCNNMKILEHLMKQTHQIPDFMKTIIMQSLIDGALVDGYVDEREKNVIVTIATLLGMDRSVALMEIHRYERRTLNENELLSSLSSLPLPTIRGGAAGGGSSSKMRRHYSTGTTSHSRHRGRRTTDPLTISDHMGMKVSSYGSTIPSPVSSPKARRGISESGAGGSSSPPMSVGSPSSLSGSYRKEHIMNLHDTITEQRTEHYHQSSMQRNTKTVQQKKQSLKDAAAATFGCHNETCSNDVNDKTNKKGDATDADGEPSDCNSSTTEILLRREVLRLRRKVDYLSHMLHEVQCTKRGEHGTTNEQEQNDAAGLILDHRSPHPCTTNQDHCMLNVKRAIIQAHEEEEEEEVDHVS